MFSILFTILLATTLASSLNIESPIWETQQQNADMNYYYSVFNDSEELNNSQVYCNFTLYKKQNLGQVIYSESPVSTFDSNTNFVVTISQTNFTDPGQYCRLMKCQAEGQTDNLLNCFDVTRSGYSITTGQAIVYWLLAFPLLILIIFMVYLIIIIPYRNLRNQKGEINFITKWKYLKIGLILPTYALILWFLNILVGVTDNYADLKLTYEFVGFIFQILNSLSSPLFVVIVIWFGFNLVRDWNIWERIKKFDIK